MSDTKAPQAEPNPDPAPTATPEPDQEPTQAPAVKPEARVGGHKLGIALELEQ